MAATSPHVTVMVTTYDGAARVRRCLDSLAAQTLAPGDFEILVIQNGPPCATPRVVEEFAHAHPELTVRLIELRRGGLGHARNVGLRAARGQWVTYVDDDDWITPHYLAALLRHADAETVPVALVSAWHEGVARSDDAHDFDNYASRSLLRWAGRTVRADLLPAAVSFNAGKLVPTELARQVEYDETLRSGEDLVYWLALLALRPFRLHVVASDEDAVYCRLLRAGSLGRQDTSYDFLVSQRLECLAALEAIDVHAADRDDATAARLAAALARGQTGWMNQFLREFPEQRHRVRADIIDRGLRAVPWGRLHRGLAETLVLLGPGDASRAGLSPWLRIGGSDRLVDVLAADDCWLRYADRVARQQVVRTRVLLPAGPDPDAWADAVADASRVWEQDQGLYRRILTLGAAPVATQAAARWRAARPELRWEVDLSRSVSAGALPQVAAGADLAWVSTETGAAELLRADLSPHLRERLGSILRVAPALPLPAFRYDPGGVRTPGTGLAPGRCGAAAEGVGRR